MHCKEEEKAVLNRLSKCCQIIVGKCRKVHEHREYRFSNCSEKGSLWRCTERFCPGRAREMEDCSLEMIRECNGHLPRAEKNEVRFLKQTASLLHLQGVEVSKSVNMVMNKCSDSILGHMPLPSTLARTVKRQSSANTETNSFPPNVDWTATSLLYEGEALLIYDSTIEDPKLQPLIIFATKEGRKHVLDSLRVSVDGCFGISPPGFAQVVVIGGIKNEVFLSGIYALTVDKTEESYVRILTILKEKLGFQPNSVSLDFELALVNAFQKVFPGISVEGCFFHFCQNIIKKLGELNLFMSLTASPHNKTIVRRILSLPFVPTHHITRLFEAIRANATSELRDFLDYFCRNYIGGHLSDGSRRSARFPPSIWNHHDQVLNQEGVTNNTAESFFRQIKFNFHSKHPMMVAPKCYTIRQELQHPSSSAHVNR